MNPASNRGVAICVASRKLHFDFFSILDQNIARELLLRISSVL